MATSAKCLSDKNKIFQKIDSKISSNIMIFGLDPLFVCWPKSGGVGENKLSLFLVSAAV